MGLPCVGARYLRPTGDAHRLEPWAACVACGRPAENAHHVVPKGAGGGSASVAERLADGTVVELRSPLLAVCGAGNACGCHGLLHSGTIAARWEWLMPEDGEAWLEGRMEPWAYRNDPRMLVLGRWVLEMDGEEMAVDADRI